MEEILTPERAKRIIEDLKERLPRKECWTCDCLQGLLTQLEIDGGQAVAEAVRPIKISSAKMHGCLGCDLCPPGEVFSEYIRSQRNPKTEEKTSKKGIVRDW